MHSSNSRRGRRRTADVAAREAPRRSYEKPSVKTLTHREVLSAVRKGAKFPARGFAG